MVLVERLMVCSVDPVQNVQEAVGSHEENVVSGQVLNLTITLEDNQLGQDGDGFQVDGESPKQVHDIDGKTILEQVGCEGDEEGRCDGEFPVEEGVLCLVVCRADGLLVFDGVDDHSSGEDVEYFHA